MRATKKPVLTPTGEQQEIIDGLVSGTSLKVEACAGSGKTATLAMAAERIEGSMLYLAYNTAAKESAVKRFGQTAECRTTHSLAFGAVGKDFMEAGRIGRRVPASETTKLLGCANASIELGGDMGALRGEFIARAASDTITRFCYSADYLPKPHHVPHYEGISADQQAVIAAEIVPWARKLWREATQIRSGHYFSHDMYMKMWALTEPFLPYDLILLDEAQDSSRLVRKLILDQRHAQIAVIGDSSQAIYAWRGATDVLTSWPSAERLSLSKSWRFGEAIAEEANAWLEHTGTGLAVRGNPAMGSRVVTRGTDIPRAVLCRSNGMVMQSAMEYIAQGKKVCITGGTDSLKSLLYAAASLMAGKRSNHPDLVAFKSWKELCAYTEEEQGRDLKVLVNLINKYSIDSLLEACKATVTPSKAEITVSTAHKAKGLEWDEVKIAEDFREPAPEVTDEGEPVPGTISKADAMLAYVSVTRARRTLDNAGLAWVHNRTTSLVEWQAANGRGAKVAV